MMITVSKNASAQTDRFFVPGAYIDTLGAKHAGQIFLMESMNDLRFKSVLGEKKKIVPIAMIHYVLLDGEKDTVFVQSYGKNQEKRFVRAVIKADHVWIYARYKRSENTGTVSSTSYMFGPVANRFAMANLGSENRSYHTRWVYEVFFYRKDGAFLEFSKDNYQELVLPIIQNSFSFQEISKKRKFNFDNMPYYLSEYLAEVKKAAVPK